MRLALVLPMLVALLGTAAHAGGPRVGEAAPDFQLVGAGGQTFSRGDFAGERAVVLAFFPRAFTPG
jgi:peroxiredoxin Q/BCP